MDDFGLDIKSTSAKYYVCMCCCAARCMYERGCERVGCMHAHTQTDPRQPTKTHPPCQHPLGFHRSQVQPSLYPQEVQVSRTTLPCRHHIQSTQKNLEKSIDRTSRSFWTIRMLVYASRYTREDFLTTYPLINKETIRHGDLFF